MALHIIQIGWRWAAVTQRVPSRGGAMKGKGGRSDHGCGCIYSETINGRLLTIERCSKQV